MSKTVTFLLNIFFTITAVLFLSGVANNRVFAYTECGNSCDYVRACPAPCGQTSSAWYCSWDNPGTKCAGYKYTCNCWQYCCTVCAPGDCGTSGGGGGTTTPTGRILGRIWIDSNGNGYQDGNEELFSSTSVTCSNPALRTPDFRLMYGSTNIMNGWYCNSGGAYYNTRSYNRGTNMTVTLTGVPSGYACDSWSYTRGSTSAGSGSGCTATLNNIAEGDNNHLWFKIRVNNTAPVCSSIYGPGLMPEVLNLTPNYPGADPAATVGFLNLRAYDGNNQQVRYSWSNNCGGTFPAISQVIIRARGSSALGGWPTMGVYKASVSSPSARSLACSFPVSRSTYGTYTCDIGSATSTLDIVFSNDAYDSATGADRNLFIDYIEVVAADGTRKTIQAESQVSGGDYVYFDRGDLPDAAFDGNDIPRLVQAIPSGAGAAGTEFVAAWNGSLRFPGTIFKTPATQPAGGTCKITATTSDGTASGSSCNKDIAVCGMPPSGITPTNPVNGQINVPVSNTLAWNLTSWGGVCPTYTQVNTSSVRMGQTSNPAGSDWSTECTGLTQENQLCAVSLEHNKTYFWQVTASNGQLSSSSPVWTFTTEPPQPSKGWFTAINGGDVYGKIIEVKGPAEKAVPLTDFSIPVKLAYGTPSVKGSVFSGDSIQFDPTTTMEAAEENAMVVKNANLKPEGSSNWLELLKDLTSGSLTGDSETKVEITSSNLDTLKSLDPKKVYVMNDSAVDALESAMETSCVTAPTNCTYDLSEDGVAIIYYLPGSSSSKTFEISNIFRRQSVADTGKRVLLVTNANVSIDKDLVTPSPGINTRASLELGIISSGTITFEGNALDSTEIPENLDTTIIVEGPLIASSIVFNRVTEYNASPGTIVKYNPLYLKGVNSFTSATNPLLFKGVLVSETYWGEAM